MLISKMTDYKFSSDLTHSVSKLSAKDIIWILLRDRSESAE